MFFFNTNVSMTKTSNMIAIFLFSTKIMIGFEKKNVGPQLELQSYDYISFQMNVQPPFFRPFCNLVAFEEHI